MEQKNTQARFAIVAVIVSIAVVGFATGLTIPLVALRMLDRQYGTFMIGLLAATPALGIVMAAPAVRYFLSLLGPRKLLFVCFTVSASSIMLLEFVSSLALVFPLRLAMGAAAGMNKLFQGMLATSSFEEG